MAEQIHLAEKYSSKVAERFKMKSLATGFTNRDYDWDGVKSIKIYSIPTVPLYDYNRNGKVYQVGDSSTYLLIHQLEMMEFHVMDN